MMDILNSWHFNFMVSNASSYWGMDIFMRQMQGEEAEQWDSAGPKRNF